MERFGASLRTSSAVGLEDFVHGSAIRRRKCFYDEEGRDIRLSVPGVRWADVRLIRKDALDKFKSKCQEVFDQIYDQIAEARRFEIALHTFVKTYMYTTRTHTVGVYGRSH